ncbi:MAG: trimethylamine methyltransferase family protein [Alphaproteobacteria bacterium]|nr:trimethylamine methyltransferase family protein [Alphaproteobacteria bacterium]
MGRRARGEGRARQLQRSAAGGGMPQLSFQRFDNPHAPMTIVSDDQLEAIHTASLAVLEEIGLNFLLPEACEILRKAGADVDPDSERVRFERGFIEEKLATAPSAFTLHARNPAHDLRVGGNTINFCSIGSPPNASDLDGGRRRGARADFENFLRLSQYFNICHLVGGYPVEPTDIETPIRHLEGMLALQTLTDKGVFCYSLSRQRVVDMVEMTKIGMGLDDEGLMARPSLWSIVNANSPLQYDRPMLWGMIELAKRNQPVCVTPFTLSGAMAPVTVAGAVVQQNAEALAGLAFLQTVNPGAPAIYGGFTSNVDMKTGSPAFGTPEYAKATLLGAQLARRYRVPFRASNVNASNAPDAQSAYEAEMSIWACALGHTNIVMHGLGWLEGGLTASFEKFIIDVEICQMMGEFLKPLEITDATMGLDAMREVGPGGHFFAAQHTLERYESAFYQPLLSDWRNFETWAEDGAVDATARANRIYKKALADYQQPPMDPAIEEALRAFVAKRTEEGGAPIQ